MSTASKHHRHKMKAAVYYSLDDIRIEDVPIPEIKPNETLVGMKACGICGSDLMEWYLKERTPMVIGHEPAGIVVKTGKRVENFELGDRVFVHHHVACLTCYYCLRGAYTMCQRFSQTQIHPGGFAEYFRVPVPNLQVNTLKIPDNLSFEEATLIEPVACCLRALKTCGVHPEDNVAVIGAGPTGILHTILLRIFGADQIIISDLIDYRLRAAEQFGANLTINPKNENLTERVKEATEGRGTDIVIVTAPNINALSVGIDICRKGGTICLFAPTSPEEHISVQPHKLFFSEIKIVPSYSTSHVETRIALKLIKSRKVKAKDLITHRFPLSRVSDAFKVATKSRECLKVVVLNE